MNWDNPSERLALIQRVGPDEYNRAFAEHMEASTVATVGGHGIRTVNSSFGKLYAVGATGRAFYTQQDAEEYAKEYPL